MEFIANCLINRVIHFNVFDLFGSKFSRFLRKLNVFTSFILKILYFFLFRRKTGLGRRNYTGMRKNNSSPIRHIYRVFTYSVMYYRGMRKNNSSPIRNVYRVFTYSVMYYKWLKIKMRIVRY